MGFSLTLIFPLILELQARDNGKHVLSSYMARQEAQQVYTPVRPVLGHFHSAVTEQLRPPRRVTLFGSRKLFEDFGALTIFFCTSEGSIQRNTVLFLDEVGPITADIGPGGVHNLILCRRRTWLSVI